MIYLVVAVCSMLYMIIGLAIYMTILDRMVCEPDFEPPGPGASVFAIFLWPMVMLTLIILAIGEAVVSFFRKRKRKKKGE